GGEGGVDGQVGDGQVVGDVLADVHEDGAGAGLDLLHDGGEAAGGTAAGTGRLHAPARGAQPGGLLQVGEEVDFAFVELAGRLAEQVLDGVEGGGQVGVAVGQA